MITDRIKEFIESQDYALVASADQEGKPHLAAGRGLKVVDSAHLAIEAWFCHRTLKNVLRNPRVAVGIINRKTGAGYQLTGVVERSVDAAILDGYAPGMEKPGTPQVMERFLVKVDAVLEFSPESHTDRSLTD